MIVDTAPATSTRERLISDARNGLWASPPTLPARWFYDETGSQLFDQITRLPEYYPGRAETEILAATSAEIARRVDATTLIELGSGTSTKTRLLLSALTAPGRAIHFVPVDVSAETLATAAHAITRDFPSVSVAPIVADFADPLDDLPGEPGRRLLIFLGSTIGNFDVHERSAFLDRVRHALSTGDHFLLGADLVKDPARLVAAYDDAAGVTAEFNRNVIDVLRRELDADDLLPGQFEHVARWNAREARIEMRLRARQPIRAYFGALDKVWTLDAGEELLTEISVKFRIPDLRAELGQHGFLPSHSWTDSSGDFSLTLSVAE